MPRRPAAKVLERLLLPSINRSVTLADHYHGFRPLHSTTSALLQLSTQAATGINNPKPPLRTAALLIDFSKAFDTVPIEGLLRCLSISPDLHEYIARWLAPNLRGRAARCLYNQRQSPFKALKAGVPQGSVLSPSLFNIYVSDFPTPAVPHCQQTVSSYADDFTVTASHRQPHIAAEALSSSALEIKKWADTKGLYCLHVQVGLNALDV